MSVEFKKEKHGVSFLLPEKSQVVLLNNTQIALLQSTACSILDVDYAKGSLNQVKGQEIKRKDIYAVIIAPERNEIYIRSFGMKTIEILDSKTLKKKGVLKHMDWVKDMAYCPQTKSLVSCDAKGFFFNWDLDTFTAKFKSNQPRKFNEENEDIKNKLQEITRIYLAEDGKNLLTEATDCYKDTLITWNALTGKIIKAIDSSSLNVGYSDWLVVGGFISANSILLYCQRNPYPKGPYKNCELYTYDLKTNKISPREVLGDVLTVSKYCKYLVYKTDKNIVLYNLKTKAGVNLDCDLSFTQGDFSPCETKLSLYNEERMHLFDLNKLV